MKTGILIDVKNKEIKEVTLGDDYREIYKHLECSLFTCVSIDNKNDVFVDDEGLLCLTPESKFFKLRTYPEPLAGNGLILGINTRTGNSVNTTLTVDQVKGMVRFLDMSDVRNMFM